MAARTAAVNGGPGEGSPDSADGGSSSEDDSLILTEASSCWPPAPDDPEMYRVVLRSQGLEPADILPLPLSELEDGVSPEEMLVCLDLATPLPKAAWTGDLKVDWWAMNRNLIPMVAMCTSNSMHPYSRVERIVVFVVEVFWCIQVSSWLGIADACVTDCDENIQCEGQRAFFRNFTMECHLERELAQEILTGYCCSPPVLVASGCVRRLSLGSFSLGGVLFTTVLNTVFVLVSQLLMKCACMQKKAKSVRRKAEAAGYLCFGLFAAFMAPWFACCLYYLFKLRKFRIALINFFGGQVGSLLGTAAMNGVLFLVLWRIQMPKPQGGAWECFDPAEGEEDKRNFVAKFLNPRFCVSAGDSVAWARGGPPPPRYGPLRGDSTSSDSEGG